MRRPLSTALAWLVALVAAACGGGTDPSGQAPPATTAAPPPATTAAPPPATTAPAPAPAATAAPAPAATTGAEVAGDPAGLADQVTKAEAAIRNPATPPGDLAAQALVQQKAYRELVARPEWLPAVLARVPPALRQTVQDNVDAGAALRRLVGRPRTELPRWRIVSPAAAGELLGYYREAEAAFGVPWQYLAAIHLVESRMGRIRGASSAGAQGPMQFLPATWAAYGEGDINSNRDSILAAARYLRRNGAPADMANAIWNYNHSDRYVLAIDRYARQMAADVRTYYGYYHWQVFYWLASGDVLLPEGWSNA